MEPKNLAKPTAHAGMKDGSAEIKDLSMDLESIVYSLSDNLAELEKKLEPFARTSDPTPETEKLPPRETQFGNVLQARVDMLRAINMRVTSLTNRLEV